MTQSHDQTQQMAHTIRFLTMDAVEQAQSGHPGMPMGMADIATILYKYFLNFNPQDPTWVNRDRFVISNGHGSMLLYALAYLTGYKAMTIDQLKNFRQFGSLTPGHPEHDLKIGIETTTGPLGQGFANAVGMAIAERKMAHDLRLSIIDHKTYVFCGDGCLMEGITHEAASLAGHLKLNKLIVLFDDNHISIDGDTKLSISEDTVARFQSYNWNTCVIDGHDHQAIYDALYQAQTSDRPTFIACRTVIGFGAPTRAGTSKAHGSPLGKTEIDVMRQTANWPAEPFAVPLDVMENWRQVAHRILPNYYAWQNHFNQLDHVQKLATTDRINKVLPQNYKTALHQKILNDLQTRPHQATRKSSGDVIETLLPYLPQLLGGSANLTSSNLTKATTAHIIAADNFSGNYIHYGIREHAMAACMNGMAVYGGIIPFGGTFLTFSDYCRPAIRLSALMKQQVIYIMTHDSIGLGEDGPTHQPIEHLSSLRCIPNLLVLRPADSIEVSECWHIALQQKNRPTVICLSRQEVPTLRATQDNTLYQSLFGGYCIRTHHQDAPLDVTIIATGTEVSIAVEAQQHLFDKGINAQIISMPSQELFFEQPHDYQCSLIPKNALTYVIEAGSAQSWDRFICSRDHISSINQFGASAPFEELYEYFGFTPSKIALKIEKILKNIEV